MNYCGVCKYKKANGVCHCPYFDGHSDPAPCSYRRQRQGNDKSCEQYKPTLRRRLAAWIRGEKA